jgi:hypothetical protein
MKIRPVGDELFHADRGTNGRTDITKLVVAFRNFANAPKNLFLGSKNIAGAFAPLHPLPPPTPSKLRLCRDGNSQLLRVVFM